MEGSCTETRVKRRVCVLFYIKYPRLDIVSWELRLRDNGDYWEVTYLILSDVKISSLRHRCRRLKFGLMIRPLWYCGIHTTGALNFLSPERQRISTSSVEMPAAWNPLHLLLTNFQFVRLKLHVFKSFQLDPTISHSVILNSLLFRTQNYFPFDLTKG